MDLSSRKKELERWGFRVVHEDDHSLVMVRSKWHWEIFVTKLTIFAAVRKVPHLTTHAMEEDQRYLKSKASEWDPSKLPPGFQKGRAYVVTYLADEADKEAVARATKRPAIDLAAFYYNVLVTPAGPTYFDSNMAFGAAYFPILRFFARRLAAPETPPPAREPMSVIGLVVSSVLLLLLLGLCCCFPLLAIISGQ